MSEDTYVYKIWDIMHRRYTINQGRVSNNEFHPGRVYLTLAHAEKCLQLCTDFYGDREDKELRRFKLEDYEVIG